VSSAPRVVGPLLFLFGLALFLPALGTRDLWNPDEPRYAQVAREMSATGEYLVPRLNGGVYMEKPPLFFWSIMGAAAILGRLDETAARLPSAIAAAATMALTYGIGRRLLSPRAGVLAALVLATTVKIVWQARFGQIDMLLTLLVTLAIWCWTRGYVEKDRRWYPLFFLATGLATLAKGPAGFLPPLLAILCFLAVTRDWASLRALGLGRGIVLWALVVAAWFVPASLAVGGGYAAEVGVRQIVVRYFTPWLHQSPWYHYLEVLPGDFLPWTLLLPTVAVVLWRESRDARGLQFAACWVAVTLLFFSLSPAKRGVYVLTMYPGLALLVGAAIDRIAATWPHYRAWILWSLGLLALGCAVAVAWLLIDSPSWPGTMDLDATVSQAAVLIGLFGAGSVVAFLLARGARPERALVIELALVIVVLTYSMTALLPRFDEISSLRPVAALVDREVPPGVRYGVYPYVQTPILFYGHRYAEELTTEEELNAFLRRGDRRWLVMRGGLAREWDERLPEPVAEVGVPHTESWFALIELPGRSSLSRTKPTTSEGLRSSSVPPGF
jgi:4-amino-4-deoxy-L-arabinose transferase-like glycosyltransferase